MDFWGCVLPGLKNSACTQSFDPSYSISRVRIPPRACECQTKTPRLIKNFHLVDFLFFLFFIQISYDFRLVCCSFFRLVFLIFSFCYCVSVDFSERSRKRLRERGLPRAPLCMMHTPPVSMRRIRHAASACAPLFLVLSAPKILCFYELPASLTCPSNTPCTTPT